MMSLHHYQLPHCKSPTSDPKLWLPSDRFSGHSMTEERLQRRLAAILSADVVGYSRLMGLDEAGTLSRLNALRRGLIDPMIAAHAGRIVKLMGDGALVEFASAVDAVTCAIEIQRQLREQEASSEANPIQFRIGINVGDVIIEGEDILGDGVNVAARIEGIAKPGGISISEDTWRQVQGKVAANFVDAGEQSLKNIARPVRVYRLDLAQKSATVSPASPPLPRLPDKPSIAVLAFNNMSGDPEQEYFADGVVEDVITALSRVKWLFVIARNSSFTYKNKSIDARQIGRELGVRYLLEGSIRRAGQRVRISGQLIEAATGRHIWADRFDGDLSKIFELQDQITTKVVGAVEPSLRLAEIERSQRKPTESLDAYDLYLRALPATTVYTQAGFKEAEALLRRAVALDPTYADALAALAECLVRMTLNGWVANKEASTAEACDLAGRAVAADPKTRQFFLPQPGPIRP